MAVSASGCISSTRILLHVTGNEDPAMLAALPAMNELIEISEGGWQGNAFAIANQAARSMRVGPFAPPVNVSVVRPASVPRTPRPAALVSTITMPIQQPASSAASANVPSAVRPVASVPAPAAVVQPTLPTVVAPGNSVVVPTAADGRIGQEATLVIGNVPTPDLPGTAPIKLPQSPGGKPNGSK